MKREAIIEELKEFFTIGELVCPHVHNKWGERAWQFLATDYLHSLLIIRRDILQQPMSCNGGGYTQRGLRCNRCELVASKTTPYLSSHILGQAGDFTVTGLSAAEAREAIKAAADLLPCNIRLEGGVSWLHIDTLPQVGVTAKVYEFKV